MMECGFVAITNSLDTCPLIDLLRTAALLFLESIMPRRNILTDRQRAVPSHRVTRLRRQGEDTSPGICGTYQVIAALPSLRSVPSNGAALLPTPWSKPTTVSSARPGERRNPDVTLAQATQNRP
jgi:hypothetical protein